MSGKRKGRKGKSSPSSVSDGELRSPDEKKVKESSLCENSAVLDSSSVEILDASGMTENLGSKIDCIVASLVEMNKQLERLTSSVSNLAKKFDKLDTRVLQLEAKQSETGAKVRELEDGLTELNEQVN